VAKFNEVANRAVNAITSNKKLETWIVRCRFTVQKILPSINAAQHFPFLLSLSPPTYQGDSHGQDQPH
jgi:hypothetical protein